jgi:transposase-like protein
MNENPAKRTYCKFDESFKRETVNHWLTSGKPAETIAKELDINSNLLYAWKKRFAPADAGGRAAAGAKPATLAEAQAQLDAAQREIRHLREQRDILKKTLGIIAESPLNVTNGSTR